MKGLGSGEETTLGNGRRPERGLPGRSENQRDHHEREADVHGGSPISGCLTSRASAGPHGSRAGRACRLRARRRFPRALWRSLSLEMLLELLPERLLRSGLAVVYEGADGLAEFVEPSRSDAR